MDVRKFPCMDYPLDGDINTFLEGVEDDFISGASSVAEYHFCLGKALAYVECQFSENVISDSVALSFVDRIDSLFKV